MMDEQSFAAFLQNHETMKRFSRRYRDDAALRARLAGGDYSELDMPVPPGMEIRMVQETPDTYYCPMPPDPNTLLKDKALENVAGGSTPLSTAGSAGSLATLPSCLSSGSSASTLSSVEVNDATSN